MRPPVLRALLAAVVLLAACRGCSGNAPAPGAQGSGSTRSAGQAVTVTMAYGSEKRTWLEPSPDGAIVRNLLSMWTRIIPRTP